MFERPRLKLQVGASYLNRRNEIVTISKAYVIEASGIHLFTGMNQTTEAGLTYYGDGSYLPDHESEEDLVELDMPRGAI